MHQSERIITAPNLPENSVTAVAVGKRYTGTVNSLKKLGIRIIGLESNILPGYLSGHADMCIFHFGNNLVYKSKEATGELPKGFKNEYIPEAVKSDYPSDCFLNCVRIGDKLICNTKTVSKRILEDAEKASLNIINVNQGYTKCSICVLTEKAIITDDESVYKSTQNYFDDVLLISKGSIRLETKDYGFIGGATGKLAKNIIAFNGRVDSHADHNIIIDILNKYSIMPLELTSASIEDIGSIIPLYEKSSVF